jgi:diguanylate cyclase (GGDEF)-like protein
MTLSFVLLAEFARRGVAKLGVRMPGAWIHLPLLALLCGVGYVEGIAAAKALARYGFGATGAFGTGLVLLARGGGSALPARQLLIALGVGFWCYAFAAGIVVEPAPFWPANVINQAWFVETTGVPIQLVRGVIALVLATLMWGAWGRRLIQTLDCPRYTSYVQRQFFGVLLVMVVILICGWMLTNVLGSIYRDEVEHEAAGDAELLVSGVIGAVAIPDSMVKVLASSPAIAPLLTMPDERVRAAARAVLDLHVETIGAMRGLILDRFGNVVETSARHDFEMLGAPAQTAAVWFQRSLAGGIGRKLDIDPIGDKRSYITSAPIRDAAGAFVGVAALELSLDALNVRLGRFNQAFFMIDQRDVVVLTNRPSETLRTLWPRPDLAPRTLMQRIGAPDPAPLLARPISGGEWTTFDGRRAYVLRRPVGAAPWSMVVALPVTGIAASRLLGIIITLQLAITALFYFFGRERGVRDRVQRLHRIELQERASALARQAATDPLTGLANRLRFNERLEQELARAHRSARPLSLVMYDVDYFKLINDRHGHPMGDQVLIGLSQMVGESVRQSDLLARWGGEEFALLLADTDAPAAAETAEKLRQLIAQLTFGLVGTVTCSFGVAQFVSGDTAAGLLARADSALYRAKLNGRNRVELSTPVIENVELSPAI